jgi:hypothetical protein
MNMPFFDQIFSLLANAPGNLVYHLVLAFSITGALQGAISQLRATGYPQVRRMVIGLFLLLIGQVVLFLASGLAWQGAISAGQILPSLDRAVILFSVLWIVWMWAFPEPARFWDAIVHRPEPGDVDRAGICDCLPIRSPRPDRFHLSPESLAWNIAILSVLAIGIVLLLTRRPTVLDMGWPVALLIAIGFGLDSFGPAAAIIRALCGCLSWLPTRSC